MKIKILLRIAFFVLASTSMYAQAPEKMSYQAVIRDGSDALVINQAIGMQISILQGSATGSSVYTESQTTTSNANGLVSVEIGMGTTSDDFSTIDWANDTYFIKTETDPTGGTNYTITGTSQLLSVPFALYAKTSGSSTPGPQGPVGDAGLQGIEGPIGPQGPAGTDGVDQDISGIAANASDITTNTTAIALNTDKAGITTAQANEITANTAKAGLTAGQTTILGNTSGTNTGDQNISGIATNASNITTNTTAIVLNTAKTGITAAQATAISDNTNKVGITAAQATILDNTSGTNTGDQTVITAAQASAISDNTAKNSEADGTSSGDMKYWNGTAWVVVAATVNEAATLQLIGGIPTWTGGTPPPPAIGDSYLGGKLAYILQAGDAGYDPSVPHGLIAAPSDQSSGIFWHATNDGVTATANAIGTGQANTTAIITLYGIENNAAKLCDDLVIGSYSDWYLPSIDELEKLYDNRVAIGGFDTSTNMSSFYWSSTEGGTGYALNFSFGNGTGIFPNKVETFSVRAVRAF